MDKVTYFKYCFCGIEDIRTGNYNNMQTIDSLDYINEILNSSGSKIIIPRFIGVYQDWTIKPDREEDIEFIKNGIENDVKDIEETLNQISKLLIELRGGKEEFHPNLIHICFDHSIYDEGLVRSLLGDGSERLGFSSYLNYPDFREKNTVLGYMYLKKFKDIPNELNDNKKGEEIRRIAEEGYGEVKEQLIKFGLTRDEFQLLNILNIIKNNDIRGNCTGSFLNHLVSKIELSDYL